MHLIVIKIEFEILLLQRKNYIKNWTSNIKKIRYYVGSKCYICQGTREIPTTFFQFSISIFQTNDPSVAINLILILREAIQAKTSWRGSTLVQILKVNATEAIGKLLVRVHKMQIMQHQPLADHILICMFWILSALATKGKKIFHFKIKGLLTSNLL